jgi:hypothetical protein
VKLGIVVLASTNIETAFITYIDREDHSCSCPKH